MPEGLRPRYDSPGTALVGFSSRLRASAEPQQRERPPECEARRAAQVSRAAATASRRTSGSVWASPRCRAGSPPRRRQEQPRDQWPAGQVWHHEQLQHRRDHEDCGDGEYGQPPAGRGLRRPGEEAVEPRDAGVALLLDHVPHAAQEGTALLRTFPRGQRLVVAEAVDEVVLGAVRPRVQQRRAEIAREPGGDGQHVGRLPLEGLAPVGSHDAGHRHRHRLGVRLGLLGTEPGAQAQGHTHGCFSAGRNRRSSLVSAVSHRVAGTDAQGTLVSVPEGDTVWLAARRMNTALAGATLRRGEFRIPQLATVDLAGATVREVVPRGKHLLIRLDDGRTMRTHFRMDGSWHIYRPGTTWRGGPGHDVRAVLATEQWECVGYRLHDIDLVPTDEEDRLVGHLGPDILGPDWDLQEALRRLGEHPDEQIGVALLDQRNLAGIGNLYKVESLFLLGVPPWARVADVPDLARLVERARTLMRANLHRPEQNTTGDPRRGRDHWVFGRQGRPCRRCGTAILLGDEGPSPQGGVTWGCPGCQAARPPIAPQARPGEPGGPRPLTGGGTRPVRYV